MNSKKALFNIISTVFIRVVTILSGFIITKMFIVYYGTDINGMVGSINQIIAALSIVEAGIASAAIVILYEPLKNNDTSKIVNIVYSTKKFYYQSGFLYLLVTLVLIIFYPLLIADQVSAYNVRYMIIILSCTNIVDYFFLGRYRVLLTADQRIYIINVFQGIFLIFSTIISVYLMYNGHTYIVVQFIFTFILVLRVIFIKLYVDRKYLFINKEKPTYKVELKQRWGVFVHQVSYLVLTNTDMLVLTIFLGEDSLVYVGIYLVYNYTYYALSSLLSSVMNSLVPSVGNLMIDAKELELKQLFDKFEFYMMYVLYIVYTCFNILLAPFICLYTKGVNDANYNDYKLVILFTIIAVLNSIRLPSILMISAIGHFKETQWRAALEAVINIVASIILVIKFGIYGVLLGTIVSFLYRTTDTILYNNKYIAKRTLKTTIKRIVLNTIAMLNIILVFNLYSKVMCHTYIDFLIYAIIVFIIVFIYYTLVNIIFDRQYLKDMFKGKI